MEYSIKEAAQMLNIPISTIRYYDKEGLLPSLERKSSGYRAFSERDIETLKIVLWLKKAHMPLKEIARFIQLLKEGDASLHQRLELFERRRQAMERQLSEDQAVLDFINYKCNYYRAAVEAGTEKIHRGGEKLKMPPCACDPSENLP